MTSHIEVIGNQVIVQLNGSIYVEEATAIREQLLEYISRVMLILSSIWAASTILTVRASGS